MNKVLVLNIVGLSKNLLGKNTPFINSLIKKGSLGTIAHVSPAVTCSVQSTYLTGLPPSDHGIVGNGWYFKDLAEIMFWKQSNHLVKGEMIWDAAKKRDKDFKCAQLFWWYNMYGTADISVTPRPMYPADGRKIPDIYASSEDLRFELTKKLGRFPLFHFWGPKANLKSSKWIADCALYIEKNYSPDLNLVYLPHLDYCLQKYGPTSKEVEKDLRSIDKLVKYMSQNLKSKDTEIIILSEYSISHVNSSLSPNIILRQSNLLKVKTELGKELLDPGASDAFAVCDHQIAHIYIKDRTKINEVSKLFEGNEQIDKVISGPAKQKYGLDHERSGDIILLAKPDSWFNYYYWLVQAKAPDFANTVDIHRKPGYDPVELFFDKKKKFIFLRVLWKLIKKKIGFRTLMDLISLDPSLVKGSHGAKPQEGCEPIFISNLNKNLPNTIDPLEIKNILLEASFKSRE